MPFRWPNTCQDLMLATEVAQRRPKCPADYEEIARVLSPIFSEDKKPVVVSVRACRERMNGLISKYLEEDKKALFPTRDVNAMLKSILVPTANGKPQTASSRLPFAVNAMLKVPN